MYRDHFLLVVACLTYFHFFFKQASNLSLLIRFFPCISTITDQLLRDSRLESNFMMNLGSEESSLSSCAYSRYMDFIRLGIWVLVSASLIGFSSGLTHSY